MTQEKIRLPYRAAARAVKGWKQEEAAEMRQGALADRRREPPVRPLKQAGGEIREAAVPSRRTPLLRTPIFNTMLR